MGKRASAVSIKSGPVGSGEYEVVDVETGEKVTWPGKILLELSPGAPAIAQFEAPDIQFEVEAVVFRYAMGPLAGLVNDWQQRAAYFMNRAKGPNLQGSDEARGELYYNCSEQLLEILEQAEVQYGQEGTT